MKSSDLQIKKTNKIESNVFSKFKKDKEVSPMKNNKHNNKNVKDKSNLKDYQYKKNLLKENNNIKNFCNSKEIPLRSINK